MKKRLLFFVAALSFTAFANAQNDCGAFFPTNKGAILVNKNFDAKNTLQHTTIYQILGASENFAGKDSEVAFTIIDKTDKAIDQGNIEVQCNDGTFFLKMTNRVATPEVIQILSQDTQLVGSFLDYPNTFSDALMASDFKMTGGEFSLQSKENKDDDMRVKVYNRHYEKNEQITTPAGTFDASKITFFFDVTKDKKITTYKGIEWYVVGKGIVRSETYIGTKLQNYTVLSTLRQ